MSQNTIQSIICIFGDGDVDLSDEYIKKRIHPKTLPFVEFLIL